MLAMLGRKTSCAWLRVAPVPLRAFHAVRLLPGQNKPHPRGNAGKGPANLGAARKISIMASKTHQSEMNSSRRTARPTITLELVAKHAPNDVIAEKIAASYGLDPVDYAAIREVTEEQVGRAAQILQPTVNDTAMRIHLQRVVGSFVASAYGAGQFYGQKVTQARDLTSSLANDDREEDRDAVYGFETKAARARRFAAEAGLTAYALMAAAEGAVSAYAHITGDDWKPYEPSSASLVTVSQRSAAAEMAAFN